MEKEYNPHFTAQDIAMKRILLYGEMGAKFGREWNFHVATPAEAVRALASQIKGFRAFLSANAAPGYMILVDKEIRPLDKLSEPCSVHETIRIVPYIGGAGGDSIFGVVLGGALLALTFWNPAGWFVAAGSLTALGQITFSVGMGLVLGGMAQMLAPTPKGGPRDRERPENMPSFAFDGPVNTIAQGNAMAVCYGEILAGSQVYSSGLFAQ